MNATTWFSVTILAEPMPIVVAIEARDDAHARRRATKSGHTVTHTKELPISGDAWLFIVQKFPLQVAK